MNFSIVITTYNRLSLLKRAIESALNQTVSCEVVVADDCSDDGTAEYIKSLNNKVVYYHNVENLGHSKTVNAGVSVATGDWIKLLDDDDYLAPDCIEKMVAALGNYPKAVICSCQAVQVDKQETEVSRTPTKGKCDDFRILQEDIHYAMLMEMLPFGTPVQVAFQRNAFFKSGGWDSTLDGNCDDIDSWLRIAQYGNAVILNKYLAYRTLWSASYNQKFSLVKRWKTNFLIKSRIYTRVSLKYRPYLPELVDIKKYLCLHWAIVSLKERCLITAIKIATPAIFSLSAWSFLLKIIYLKYCSNNEVYIYQQYQKFQLSVAISDW
ncbi:MAG: glycosyltransferase family 2 protein [Spirulinaceae cyanobacterium]